LLKQDKPTRKRMKQTLKKSQRFLAGKPMLPVLAKVGLNKENNLSQRRKLKS
jgi:hypothetical protein